LYGFAISACRGTDYRSVTFKTKKGKERLITFDQAIKYCQNPNSMRMTINSKHLILTEEEKESIKFLKDEFRDKFEHFIPTSWSIEIHGLPRICMNILRIIRFLAIDTCNYSHLSITMRRKLTSYICQSNKILKSSDLYREDIA